MKDYFVEAHGGFYCGICDASNQSYFDTAASKVIYSINFCRGLVENSLGPLLYMHNHFIELTQLAAGYMTKCNFKGEFIISEIIPTNMIYTFTEE